MLLAIMFVVGLSVTGIVDLSVFVSRVWRVRGHPGKRLCAFRRAILAGSRLSRPGIGARVAARERPGNNGSLHRRILVLRRDDRHLDQVVLRIRPDWLVCLHIIFGGLLSEERYVQVSCWRLILFTYVFLGGNILSTPFLIVMIVLVTLSGPEPRRDRIDTTSPYRPPLNVASGAG